MTTIDRKPTDFKVVEPTRDGRALEKLPSAAGEISALASATAPWVVFDETAFCALNQGMASITLVAHRQIAQVPGAGVLSDKVITANIRASLPAMFALRETINTLERMAKDQLTAAAEAAAAEVEAPTRRPH